MRRLVLVLCGLVAGCASSNPRPEVAPPMETIHLQTGPGVPISVAMVHEGDANGGSVPFAPDRTWAVLRAVYDSLGITVGTLDQSSHTIGNPSFKVRRQLGKTALSKYIDCGTMQGAPSADSYDVIISVMTTVRREGSGTRIMTTLDGQGRPVAMAGDWVRCSSTTALETRIVYLVGAALSR